MEEDGAEGDGGVVIFDGGGVKNLEADEGGCLGELADSGAAGGEWLGGVGWFFGFEDVAGEAEGVGGVTGAHQVGGCGGASFVLMVRLATLGIRLLAVARA